MSNDFTALKSIPAPGTAVFGYRRGDGVAADVVQAWALVVGDDVCEGDLTEDTAVPVLARPGPEANRAAWESWAIANGMTPEEAAEAGQDDLEAAGAKDSAPARKPATKPAKKAGDAVAVSATEASQA